MPNIKTKYASKRVHFMYLLLLAVAFLPASVAAEKSNEIQSLQLDEEIKHALDSALEKNPEIENCKIVVNLILEKDRQTSKWNGKIDKLEVEVVEVGLNEDQPDEVDSTMTSPVADESNSEIGNDNNKSSKGNILGWLIAVAFLVILLIAVVPRMRTNVFKDKQIPDISGKHHKGHHHLQGYKLQPICPSPQHCLPHQKSRMVHRPLSLG